MIGFTMMSTGCRCHPTMGRTSERNAPRIPLFLVDAELEIQTVEKRVVVRMRLYEQLANLEAVISRAQVLGMTVQRKIETLLEPIGHTISELGDTDQRPVGDDGAGKRRRGAPAGGEVVVHHKIELPHLGDIGVIYLDLVGLCDGQSRALPRRAIAIQPRQAAVFQNR